MTSQSRQHHCHFYGTTTLGEKGQVVIPADARQSLALAKGERLMVFSMGHNTVVLMKMANVERFAAHLSSQLAGLRDILKKTGRK
ncbi:MAG: AbrB/MazE/SpoVT family DNA-binding domain-containing protein [Patescibacteria group bacterium]